jgi:hypothetical protein
MKSSSSQIGSPGPFEVRFDDFAALEASNAQDGAAAATDDATPRRRYDCASYDRCLELAAALNWESFTCRGCSGHINDALLWRVGQAIRRDTVAKAICAAPKISTLSGSSRQLEMSKETKVQAERTPSLCQTENVPRSPSRRLE